jgi:hypothetical protein
MKTWAEFAMRGPGATNLLASFPTEGPGWHVDKNHSEHVRTRLRRPHYSIRATGDTYPEVFIGITADDEEPDLYTVTNVVPTVNGQLTKDQYNQAVLDFYDRFVRSREGPELVVSPPRGEEDLSEYLDEDGVQLLGAFSELANKSTGATHPLDAKRWRAFVIHCHVHGVDLPYDALYGALTEEFGWDGDDARELAGQYETFHELLQQYDEELEE